MKGENAMSSFPNSKAYPWALTGVFAAVHLVLSIIPAIPAVGGGAISLGAISGPLVGFLLGPIYGTLAVLIGTIIGLWANPTAAILGSFVIFPPTVGAFVAATIRAKKAIVVPVFTIYAALLFFLGPLGEYTLIYMQVHIIAAILALFMVLPPLRDSFDNIVKDKSPKNIVLLIISYWILSFAALMADHAIGSAIGVPYFNTVLGWSVPDLKFIFIDLIIYVFPIERLLMSFLLAFTIFALDRALSKTQFRPPLISDRTSHIQELPSQQ